MRIITLNGFLTCMIPYLTGMFLKPYKEKLTGTELTVPSWLYYVTIKWTQPVFDLFCVVLSNNYVLMEKKKNSPWQELIMQKRKKVASERQTKLKRPHVVPNRQVRPQILRKAMRFFLHSGRFRIFVATKKSMTAPELDTTASKPKVMM